jgi:hypothetical protein
MKIDRYDLIPHYLLVVAFYCVIAVVSATIWPVGFLSKLGYSLCIGTLI